MERPSFLNGFNSYWLMYMASDPSTRAKVSETFAKASKYGMNVARTWAFNDGGAKPLQTSSGSYNQDMFKGLDYVVSEASKHGIHLILTLVNNWDGYGGKKQYVQWAREQGHSLNNDDEFFTNPIVKGYFKNYFECCPLYEFMNMRERELLGLDFLRVMMRNKDEKGVGGGN
ncbi:hypothetical protein SASPL_137667 [Salvia splendens]|uniref:mannan endo-1,4-beta-mannosidase n=1 Tax=Salvia splendens TaxID=180675 RepID=A0A8X8WV95_SALSN|nr:hypothetical protein SASPL_137667 [Salvia splendens]